MNILMKYFIHSQTCSLPPQLNFQRSLWRLPSVKSVELLKLCWYWPLKLVKYVNAFQLFQPGVVKVLPGEVLLQCHHLLPSQLRLHPLPSLHAQMLFILQLGIIIMDQSLWRSCRGEE